MTRALVGLVLALGAMEMALGFSATGRSVSQLKYSVARVPLRPRRDASTMKVLVGGGSVKSLLGQKRSQVDALAAIAPEMSEIALLRFALAFPNVEEAKGAVKEAMAWRKGAGKGIVEAASQAVATATAGGSWSNDAVRAAAPHATKINEFITPKNILSLSTEEGDLLYIIRASLINDNRMMSQVSVDQLSEFFAYVKEIHSIVANTRSEKTGRLCEVIFANDISGIRSPPNPQFSKALTSSSEQYEKLYPSLAGPTMILNLPFVLQAFIGLFKPLFPKTVQARLKFERAPVLASLKELTPLTSDRNTREKFLREIDNLLVR